MTTPEAAALADALDRAIVYTSQSHDGAVTVLPVETARNLIAYLEVTGYALTPLAPEVPPRPDGLREALAEMTLAYHTFNGRCTTDLPSCQAALCLGAKQALAATRTPEPPDSEPGTVAPWTGKYLPPILDQSQHEDRQVEPPARRIRPQGTITHQHNGWHDHPLVDLGDATAATEPHVHRRPAEPPDSGDGAGIDAALLAEALPDALSAMTEGDDETPAPQPSDEPGSPYVVGLARALAARLRSGSPAPEGGE